MDVSPASFIEAGQDGIPPHSTRQTLPSSSFLNSQLMVGIVWCQDGEGIYRRQHDTVDESAQKMYFSAI